MCNNQPHNTAPTHNPYCVCLRHQPTTPPNNPPNTHATAHLLHLGADHGGEGALQPAHSGRSVGGLFFLSLFFLLILFFLARPSARPSAYVRACFLTRSFACLFVWSLACVLAHTPTHPPTPPSIYATRAATGACSSSSTSSLTSRASSASSSSSPRSAGAITVGPWPAFCVFVIVCGCGCVYYANNQHTPQPPNPFFPFHLSCCNAAHTHTHRHRLAAGCPPSVGRPARRRLPGPVPGRAPAVVHPTG